MRRGRPPVPKKLKTVSFTISSTRDEKAAVIAFARSLSYKTPMDLFRYLLRALNDPRLKDRIREPNMSDPKTRKVI